jgi:UDPglucose 6-dehydrogenase
VVKGKRLAVLGLAFKANTDDIGFAPALEVMRRLLEEGAEVHASDPEAIPRTRSPFPQVTYFEDPYEALKGVDAALACTEWQIFRTLDWERAGKAMARRVMIDGRNLYSPIKMQQLCFEYYAFGRIKWRRPISGSVDILATTLKFEPNRMKDRGKFPILLQKNRRDC